MLFSFRFIDTGALEEFKSEQLEDFYMQRIFESVKQTLAKRVLILAMLSLSFVSSLFIFVQQPSVAAPISTEGKKLLQMEKMDQESQTANPTTSMREKAYEEQVKAAQDLDKTYEENLKTSKAANSDEGPVQKAVEGAKKLVDKATSNE